jgi:hypothetical protein
MAEPMVTSPKAPIKNIFIWGGVGRKPQNFIFSVLSGIKLKLVFIQKINV